MMELDIVPSEDEFDAYVPLERPVNAAPAATACRPPEPIVYSDDDCENNSSSYDSDEAHTQLPKPNLKRKLMQRPPAEPAANDKKKKYSMWSEILQEEAIENQFVQSEFFGGGDRGNESYNYRLKHIMEIGCNSESKDPNQQTDDFAARKKVKAFSKNRGIKKTPIILSDLSASEIDSADDVAADIAKSLNEQNIDLIERVVETLGNRKAIQLFRKTQETEKNGGLLILNGSRRRTSGGVFLKLVKDEKLSSDQYAAIFREEPIRNWVPKKFYKNKGKYSKKKDEFLKSLPTRCELEVSSMSNEEGEMNVLKNPPPSPVYLSSATSSSAFSLTDSAALSSHFSQTSVSKKLNASNLTAGKSADSSETDSYFDGPGFGSPNSAADSTCVPMESTSVTAEPENTTLNYHSPTYSPHSPVYSSINYTASQPEYDPSSSQYKSSSPQYSRTSPVYSPSSPQYSPSSPQYGSSSFHKE